MSREIGPRGAGPAPVEENATTRTPSAAARDAQGTAARAAIDRMLAERRPRAQVEPASADQVTLEHTSERILLDAIANTLKLRFAEASNTVLRALTDFQAAVAGMQVEVPEGMAAALANRVAQEALDNITEKVLERAAEFLGPVNWLVKGSELVVEVGEKHSSATEAVEKNRILQGVVSAVQQEALRIKEKGAAAVENMRTDCPMELLALNGSATLTRPLLDGRTVRDQIVASYERALRAAGLRTLEQQIHQHDYARFDAAFEAREQAKKEKP